MTEQQGTQPTAEQLAAAAAAIAAQQTGLGPAGGGMPEGALAAQLAAGQAAAGQAMGATEVDVTQLLALIQQMQDRVTALEAEKAAADAPALLANAQSLAALLAGYPVGIVVQAAADLVDAAKNALESGDTSHVTRINAQLGRLLQRHRPAQPVESTSAFAQALDFAAVHIPDSVDAFKPAAKAAAPLPARSLSRPVPVIAGNVTG